MSIHEQHHDGESMPKGDGVRRNTPHNVSHDTMHKQMAEQTRHGPQEMHSQKDVKKAGGR